MTTGNGHLYSCLARFGKCPTSLLCDKYWNVVHPYWSWLPDGNCSWMGNTWYFGQERSWIMVSVGYFLRYRYKSYMTIERIRNAKTAFIWDLDGTFTGLL